MAGLSGAFHEGDAVFTAQSLSNSGTCVYILVMLVDGVLSFVALETGDAVPAFSVRFAFWVRRSERVFVHMLL